jgi:AraC-like DNA-binding protein
LFGRHLQFNADFNGFAVPPADLDHPRDAADPGLALHATMLVHHVLNPGEPTLVQRVGEATTYLLGSSRATVVDAAEVLGMHPRTLQRRLESEGVTFRELIHQTRVRLAARFLANPNLTITEVAEALGYSSSGAFSRWYRHEFGRPPKQGRGNLAANLNDPVSRIA